MDSLLAPLYDDIRRKLYAIYSLICTKSTTFKDDSTLSSIIDILYELSSSLFDETTKLLANLVKQNLLTHENMLYFTFDVIIASRNSENIKRQIIFKNFDPILPTLVKLYNQDIWKDTNLQRKWFALLQTIIENQYEIIDLDIDVVSKILVNHLFNYSSIYLTSELFFCLVELYKLNNKNIEKTPIYEYLMSFLLNENKDYSSFSPLYLSFLSSISESAYAAPIFANHAKELSIFLVGLLDIHYRSLCKSNLEHLLELCCKHITGDLTYKQPEINAQIQTIIQLFLSSSNSLSYKIYVLYTSMEGLLQTIDPSFNYIKHFLINIFSDLPIDPPEKIARCAFPCMDLLLYNLKNIEKTPKLPDDLLKVFIYIFKKYRFNKDLEMMLSASVANILKYTISQLKECYSAITTKWLYFEVDLVNIILCTPSDEASAIKVVLSVASLINEQFTELLIATKHNRCYDKITSIFIRLLVFYYEHKPISHVHIKDVNSMANVAFSEELIKSEFGKTLSSYFIKEISKLANYVDIYYCFPDLLDKIFSIVHQSIRDQSVLESLIFCLKSFKIYFLNYPEDFQQVVQFMKDNMLSADSYIISQIQHLVQIFSSEVYTEKNDINNFIEVVQLYIKSSIEPDREFIHESCLMLIQSYVDYFPLPESRLDAFESLDILKTVLNLFNNSNDVAIKISVLSFLSNIQQSTELELSRECFSSIYCFSEDCFMFKRDHFDMKHVDFFKSFNIELILKEYKNITSIQSMKNKLTDILFGANYSVTTDCC